MHIPNGITQVAEYQESDYQHNASFSGRPADKYAI
jgi:hypothetical protein